MVDRYSRFGVATVKDLRTVLPELLHRVEALHELNPMIPLIGGVEEAKIFAAVPFAVLDQERVGKLV